MAAPPAYRAVILDAGSGGTRAYVYHIQPASGEPVLGNIYAHAKVTELFTKSGKEMRQTAQGIHTVAGAGNLADAVAIALDATFDDVTETIGDIQDTDRCCLYATAGMRGLDAGQQNNIIAALVAYIQTKGFAPANIDCRTISGTLEAKYGWIAANYAQRDNTWPYGKGYVEMGGASMQIAFLLPVGIVAGNERLVQVQNAFGLLNEAMNASVTVQVAGRLLFLASCQLGGKAGHNAYKRVLQAPGIQVNANTVRDPTKIPAYNAQYHDNGTEWTMLGVQGQGATVEGRLHLCKPLIDRAIQAQLPLHPAQANSSAGAIKQISDGLRVLHKDYHFLAGAGFWFTMGLNRVDPHSFNFRDWLVGVPAAPPAPAIPGINESLGDTNTQDDERHLTSFKGLWMANVMWDVFGLGWNSGQAMTFMPYNGPAGKRLSWTLGKAVLLATGEPLAAAEEFAAAAGFTHLCPPFGPCFGA